MALKDIDEDSWLQAFQICRDTVLAGKPTKSLAPNIETARTYFVTDGTVIVSMKAVAKLASNLARQDFHEVPAETQSQRVFTHLNSLEFLQDARIMTLHGAKGEFKEGIAPTDFGLGDDTPEGGYSYGPSKNRKNQSKFKMLLLAQRSTCAVTGCDVMALLHACHIDAYSETQDHSIDNGIFLRLDFHRMFDLGLLAYDSNSQVWKIHKSVRGGYKKYHKKKLQYKLGDATIARLEKHFQNSAFATRR